MLVDTRIVVTYLTTPPLFALNPPYRPSSGGGEQADASIDTFAILQTFASPGPNEGLGEAAARAASPTLEV